MGAAQRRAGAGAALRLRVIFDADLVEAFLDDAHSLVTRAEKPLAGSAIAVVAAPRTAVRLFDLRLPERERQPGDRP